MANDSDVTPHANGQRPKTVLNNPPAVGAPKNWPWGYLPCGCRNDGFGRHVQ